MKHLWEVKHSYYCEEHCYNSNLAPLYFESWQEFMLEEGDSDKDLNLVFRWDWKLPGYDDCEEFVPDNPLCCNSTLQICYIGQRKGIYRSVIINVCLNDEEPVKAWLQARWNHLKELWEPLA